MRKDKLLSRDKRTSIRFLIMISMTLTAFIAILVIGVTTLTRYSKSAEDSATFYIKQIIGQVNMNVGTYLQSMMDISNYIADICYENDVSESVIRSQMEVLLKSRTDIVSIVLFDRMGNQVAGVPFSSLPPYTVVSYEEWFKKPQQQPENTYFSSPHVQQIYSQRGETVISVSRSIQYKKDDRLETGVLLVDLNFNTIDQLCQQTKLGEDGYIYFINANNDVVYHPFQKEIDSGDFKENVSSVRDQIYGSFFEYLDGERRFVYIETVSYSRWRIVGVSGMNEIADYTTQMISFFIITLLAGLLVIIFASSLISKKIADPIREIEETMQLVENGNFDLSLDVDGCYEAQKLADTFNTMILKIKDLMDQIIHEQREKRKSEFSALQAQINPHFLYNTLDSIIWMAENGNHSEVITMTTSLARFFRISLSKGKNIIPVRDEIEHAKNYLVIQKIRYKNKFEYSFDVSEEVYQYYTLKLLLQPIIENALYHGIEYMVDPGLIRVTVRVENDRLLYMIEDNGVGMDADTAKNLLTLNKKSEARSGVGVKNVNERIQLFYGSEYGLEVESELEEGTTVKIWLPLIDSPNE